MQPQSRGTFSTCAVGAWTEWGAIARQAGEGSALRLGAESSAQGLSMVHLQLDLPPSLQPGWHTLPEGAWLLSQNATDWMS